MPMFYHMYKIESRATLLALCLFLESGRHPCPGLEVQGPEPVNPSVGIVLLIDFITWFFAERRRQRMDEVYLLKLIFLNMEDMHDDPAKLSIHAYLTHQKIFKVDGSLHCLKLMEDMHDCNCRYGMHNNPELVDHERVM